MACPLGTGTRGATGASSCVVARGQATSADVSDAESSESSATPSFVQVAGSPSGAGLLAGIIGVALLIVGLMYCKMKGSRSSGKVQAPTPPKNPQPLKPVEGTFAQTEEYPTVVEGSTVADDEFSFPSDFSEKDTLEGDLWE